MSKRARRRARDLNARLAWTSRGGQHTESTTPGAHHAECPGTTVVQPPPAALSEVIIATPGYSVLVRSPATLDDVATRAEQLHIDALRRHGSMPQGFGGSL